MSTVSPYFEGVPAYGDLEMEQVIVEYDYPLLSVLKDSLGRRYLCMCFDTRGAQQWLVTPITNADLAALLENKMPLAVPFLSPDTEKVLATRDYETKADTFDLVCADRVPKENLPEAGEYLDAEPGEWDEYVRRLCPASHAKAEALAQVGAVVTEEERADVGRALTALIGHDEVPDDIPTEANKSSKDEGCPWKGDGPR